MDNFFWNLSHIYELDNTSQWTGRCFFTYFLDAEKYSFEYRFIEFIIYCLIFGISFTENFSVIVSIIRNPEMKTVANCFVLNIAAADLVFVSTIPLIAYTRFFTSWKLGEIGCKVIPYIQIVSASVLLWTSVFIAIEHCGCVGACSHRLNTSIRETHILLLILWIIAAIVFNPLLLWFRKLNIAQSNQVCTLIIPEEYSTEYSEILVSHILFFASVLPILLLGYIYVCVYKPIVLARKITHSYVNVRDSQGRTSVRRQSDISYTDFFIPRSRRFYAVSDPSRVEIFSQQRDSRLSKRIDVIRLLCISSIVVLAMWLPLIIVTFLIYVDGNRSKDFLLRSSYFVTALLLAGVNTIINPALYFNFPENAKKCCCSDLYHETGQPIPMRVRKCGVFGRDSVTYSL